jgi:hypothetical protein
MVGDVPHCRNLLPAPGMRVDAVVSGAAESPVYTLLAEAVRSLVPTLQKLDIASPAHVQIDTLARAHSHRGRG